jgi:agmatine deiminase
VTLEQLGFRQPAEWAPHQAVWTAWPHLVDEWAEGVVGPRVEMAAMCAAISDGGRGERIELLVRDADVEANAREALAGVEVRYHRLRYGDVWLRDTGPVFVTKAGAIAAARFRFDGWGGKYLMDGDTEVSGHVARIAGVPDVAHDYVLEGGAIEVDGAGIVMTTRQCLIGGARNPGADERIMEARLRAALGVERVVWLDRGLANDHTDGHIDTIARFVAPGVVACMEPAAGDPNADAMREIIADLGRAKLEVVTVPSPGAILDAAGTLMPASYMNFYIGNTTVVVPTYDAAPDDAAVARLATMFPDRRVVGTSGRAIVVGGGAFHCCTQQQPVVP